MEEIGISDLSNQQLEKLCEIAEKAARDYVTSKVSIRRISQLDISVNTEDRNPVTVNVEVELVLSPLMKDYDVDKLAADAIEKAFSAISTYLREL